MVSVRASGSNLATLWLCLDEHPIEERRKTRRGEEALSSRVPHYNLHPVHLSIPVPSAQNITGYQLIRA